MTTTYSDAITVTVTDENTTTTIVSEEALSISVTDETWHITIWEGDEIIYIGYSSQYSDTYQD